MLQDFLLIEEKTELKKILHQVQESYKRFYFKLSLGSGITLTKQ